MNHHSLRSLILHLVIPVGFIVLMMVGQVSPELFMYGNSFLFILLLCGTVLFKKERTFLSGCMIVPLAVIVSLSLSKLQISVRSILFYGTFFSVGLSFTREYLYIKLHLFSLPPWYKLLFFTLMGFLLGEALSQISLISHYSFIDEMISHLEISQLILLLPVITIGEEIMYRRVIQNESEKIVPPFLSVVVTSVLYAVLFFPLGPLPVFVAYMLSIFLGVTYLFSRRILLTGVTSFGIKIGFLTGLLIFNGSLWVH